MHTASKRSKLAFSVLVSIVGLAGASAGCSAADDGNVGARLEVIDRSGSALSAASITAITGTYGATCDGRHENGTEAWTLTMEGEAANDELSVRKNDADCVLTVRNVVAGGATYIGDPAMALTTTDYKESASGFAEDEGPLAFYGNAKIDSLAFADNFTISLLVSADSSASADSHGATYATQSGSVSQSEVPASEYTISFFAEFAITKDANNVVLSADGYAQLALANEAIAGQSYVVYDGALTSASSFAVVDAAFKAGTAAPVPGDLQLPASAFTLETKTLEQQRTVIISNTAEGVTSYQLLLITFLAT
jgi:hypothetical protein